MYQIKMDSHKVQKKIARIKSLNWKEMSKREYYTRLMKILRSFGEDPDLELEDAEDLVHAITESGMEVFGLSMHDWADEQKREGKKVCIEEDMDSLCDRGDISGAVACIHHVVYDPYFTNLELRWINQGGYFRSLTGRWVDASELILARERKEKRLAKLMEEDERRMASEEENYKKGGEEPSND